MSITLYAASVPVFKQMLNSLSDILHKTEAGGVALQLALALCGGTSAVAAVPDLTAGGVPGDTLTLNLGPTGLLNCDHAAEGVDVSVTRLGVVRLDGLQLWKFPPADDHGGAQRRQGEAQVVQLRIQLLSAEVALAGHHLGETLAALPFLHWVRRHHRLAA